MSKQIAEETSRVSFSVGGATLSRFDELADEQGKNRSELLRELMQRELDRAADDAGDYVLPDDDALADAYRTLHRIAEYDPKRRAPAVSLERAENELYGTDLPKDSVVREVIEPLRDSGWVNIDHRLVGADVVVRPLTPQEAVTHD